MALGYKSHVERPREQGLKQKVELQSFQIDALTFISDDDDDVEWAWKSLDASPSAKGLPSTAFLTKKHTPTRRRLHASRTKFTCNHYT